MGSTPVPAANNATPEPAGNNNAAPAAPQKINDPNLPDEVQGLTPEEVVAYYQKREQKIQQRYEEIMNQPPANNNAASNEPVIDNSQFWNDPNSAIKTTVNQLAPTREEFNAAAESVQKSLVNVALLTIAQKHADWERWKDSVERTMQPLPPHLRADPEQWEIAYKYVKGEQYDKDVAAAKAEGARISAEPAQEPAAEPVMPEELSAPQKYVASHLGISDDKYKEGVANLRGDKWPITFDSRNMRR